MSHYYRVITSFWAKHFATFFKTKNSTPWIPGRLSCGRLSPPAPANSQQCTMNSINFWFMIFDEWVKAIFGFSFSFVYFAVTFLPSTLLKNITLRKRSFHFLFFSFWFLDFPFLVLFHLQGEARRVIRKFLKFDIFNWHGIQEVFSFLKTTKCSLGKILFPRFLLENLLCKNSTTDQRVLFNSVSDL